MAIKPYRERHCSHLWIVVEWVVGSVTRDNVQVNEHKMWASSIMCQKCMKILILNDTMKQELYGAHNDQWNCNNMNLNIMKLKKCSGQGLRLQKANES